MSLAKRSDFTYHVEAVGGEPVLVIKDKDTGGMTVTNNMDAVLHYIEMDIGFDLIGSKIVYRSICGIYHGVQYMGNGNHVIYPPSKGQWSIKEEDAVASVRSRAMGR